MSGNTGSTGEIVALRVISSIVVAVRDDLPLQHVVRGNAGEDPVSVARVEGPGLGGILGDLIVGGTIPTVYILLRGIKELAPIAPPVHLEPRAIRGVGAHELAELPVNTEGPTVLRVCHLHPVALRGLRGGAVTADAHVAGVAVAALPVEGAPPALAAPEAGELRVLGEPGPKIPPGSASPALQNGRGDRGILTCGLALTEREGLEGHHGGGLLSKIVLGVLHGAQGGGIVPAGSRVQVAPRPGAVDLNSTASVTHHVAQLLAPLPGHTEGIGVHVKSRVRTLAVGIRPRLAVLLGGIRRVALLVASLPGHGGLDSSPLLRGAVPGAHPGHHGAGRLGCPCRCGIRNINIVGFAVPHGMGFVGFLHGAVFCDLEVTPVTLDRTMEILQMVAARDGEEPVSDLRAAIGGAV
mmetsp:Transcript_44492/g.100546  ORF Transcript_44492/g.100546 Transcript_44492/m.100546 type:complete len:410 (+) Transcript_44492:4745-5974(+)